MKSKVRRAVSSVQIPKTAPRDNAPIVSEAQFEVNRGSLYTAPGSQNAPLPQSGRVNFVSKINLKSIYYRSSGIEQQYFPDEQVNKLSRTMPQKTAPVSLLYFYALKNDDLFLSRPELSKFSEESLKFKLFISNFETYIKTKL